MDIVRKKIRLGDLLVGAQAISEEQLMEALTTQKGSGKKLGEVLVDEGYVTEEDIAKALSSQLGYELRSFTQFVPNQDLISQIPIAVVKKNKVFPLGYAEDNMNVIVLAMADPLDMYAQDDIAIMTGCNIRVVVATTRDIMLAIDKYYDQGDMYMALEEYAKEKKLGTFGEAEEEAVNQESINNSPIVMMVTDIIDKAVRQEASDIHIEPLEKMIRIRYRIDGVLYQVNSYDINLLGAMIARVKIIGGMDIAEHRKPQDGRITHILGRSEYDIRVSILPTVFGEKAVMRITSKNNFTRDKSQLGFKPRELEQFDYILQNPHGIVLVTGPTGSGKSTTLYAALSELNKEGVNIITVEDPVEANLPGVNQVQVNPKADLTFETSLRSILRQDPDIIMIGEIRDTQTAQIAVQASITGHLVVSTLHTNSSAGTITRLEDMGIEPYLIADAVTGVIAQRLVRKLCNKCKKMRPASEREKEFMNIPVSENVEVYEPCGCEYCGGKGYKGRIGVYEIMRMTPELKRIISHREGAEAIKEQALKEGMYTLKMSAMEYVLDGTTSFEEMMKVSFDV